MILVRIVLGSLLALAIIGFAIRLLHPLPPLEPRQVSRALNNTADTPLGRGASPLVAAYPQQSGVHPLSDGRDAFAARALLARAATRSLDVHYYIWHSDLSGSLMLEEMHRAAERGVRVRMLLDDNGIAGLNEALAALETHPNIEVRLFNPFTVRRPKQIGYLADFPRLNRRMHNKSFTADGHPIARNAADRVDVMNGFDKRLTPVGRPLVSIDRIIDVSLKFQEIELRLIELVEHLEELGLFSGRGQLSAANDT